jgi:hypothetical protein
MVPLTLASLLTKVIVGGAQEQLDLENIIKGIESETVKRFTSGETRKEINNEIHARLMEKGQLTTHLAFDDIYDNDDVTEHDVNVFSGAPTLEKARNMTKRVHKPNLKTTYYSSPARMYSKLIRSEEPKQTIDVTERVVNLEQVKRAVNQSLSRRGLEVNDSDED